MSLTALRSDVLGGLTVAVLMIPQCIAYGLLAGVPPRTALVAGLVPSVLYVVFGTSRQLSVGPAALISLMAAEAVAAVGPDLARQSEGWVALIVLLTVLAGAIQLGLGLARLGSLVNFISKPVINGFMSAAALIIAASQLGLLLGVDLAGGGFVTTVADAISRYDEVHLGTLFMALGCVLLLVLGRGLAPRAPIPFLLVVVTTALTWGLSLHTRGLDIVGAVPAGLPVPTLPALPEPALLIDLLPYAVGVAFVGFLESISIAQSMAFRHRTPVHPNQELVALGLGNLGAGLFGGLVSTGNISRTAVADQSGVRTPVAALVTAGGVLLTLAFLAPLFTYLPKATLAAIIVVAVVGFVDLGEPARLALFKRNDAVALIATFVATLVFGVTPGILGGVGVALALHLHKTSRPHAPLLGRVPGTQHYRSLARHSRAIVPDGLMILRVDESLYFANAPALKQSIELAWEEAEVAPRAFILDCSAVNDLDATALDVLEQVADELHSQGSTLALAGVSAPVHDILIRSGVLDHVGFDMVYIGVHEAVEALEGR